MKFFHRIVNLFSHAKIDQEINDELRAHIEMRIDDGIAAGMSPEAARRNALLRFGNPAIIRERVTRVHVMQGPDIFFGDLRYATRMLSRSKGFALASVLALALGMGANTAIFSLINAVLLRPLPVENPSQLYFLKYSGASGVGIAPPYPYFERLHAQSKTLAGAAAFGNPGDLVVRLNGNLEHASGSRVSGDFFRVLGLQPALGRLLTPEDQKLNPAAAVIGYDYWQQRFGGSSSVVGMTFVSDSTRFTVVGVLPRGYKGLVPGKDSDYVLPISTMQVIPHDGAGMLADTGSSWFEIVGRLKSGVQPEQARAEVDSIFQAYFTDYPQPPEVRRDHYREMVLTSAACGLDDMRKQFTRPLMALMGLVGLVFLIACSNVTNLLLARAAKREREFAIKVALGAGRVQLFRQLLVETAMLFAAGMTTGALVAWYAVKTLATFLARGTHSIRLDAHWDWRVLMFTTGVSLLATLVFGAAPIFRAVRTDPHAALRDGAELNASGGQLGLGRLLVVLQVSLSLVLLVGALLFLQTLHNLHTISLGFRPQHVVVTKVQLLESSYRQEATRVAMWSRVLGGVRSLPGVESATVSEMTPMDTSGRHVGFKVDGYHSRLDFLNMNTVSEDYFKTLEVPLLKGRSFTSDDNLQTTFVALLNATAVKNIFAGRDPIGTTIHVNEARYRIVGVVPDIKESDVRETPQAVIYLPMRQPYDRNFRMTLSVKTAMDPAEMIPTIEREVRAAGSDTLVTHTGTLRAQIDDTLVQERLISGLTAAFGVLALLLSAMGLYGVLAGSVVRRTQKIEIRLALGEMPRQILRKILCEMAWLVGVGLAVGIPASMLLARMATSLLYGVSPKDMWTQMIAAVFLAIVGLAGSCFSVCQASRTDSLTAFRYE